jgi:hypothetical protein
VVDPFGPSRAESFFVDRYRALYTRLPIQLRCGEHGTVEPLRVSNVEPVTYPNDSHTVREGIENRTESDRMLRSDSQHKSEAKEPVMNQIRR